MSSEGPGDDLEDGDPRAIVLRGTGNAHAETGGIANTGNLTINYHQPFGVVAGRRPDYRLQVRQLAPPRLIGRGRELAELEEFCTADLDHAIGPYRWWQAPAWAGKSALMSWFVLHPPERVRVVSFFITARLAGQSDRNAFLESVLWQLTDITGRDSPAILSETSRQAWFLEQLTEASFVCRHDGKQLILLVDGLDEDHVADGHSIAALLPAPVPEGLRVIVAGRPHPPIPSDVPLRHPLRDQAIVRPLTVAREARTIRAGLEREIDGLIAGTGLGHDVLGLVAAAGGGLSLRDLGELTGESPGRVRHVVCGPSGRVFTGQPSVWRPGVGPDVFLLAHEELQVVATEELGDSELGTYRGRLHSWGDSWRAKGWPEGTPEYLLRGYFRLLAVSGDVERMVDRASDLALADRMLDASGGDAIALADIATTQELICRHEEPDLTSLLALAVTKTSLTHRNGSLPPDLPAAWAAAGNFNRAEALANSIARVADRGFALRLVAETIGESGDLDRAEALARAIPDRDHKDLALANLVLVAGKADDPGRAAAFARAVTIPFYRSLASENLARIGELSADRTPGEVPGVGARLTALRWSSERPLRERAAAAIAAMSSGDNERAAAHTALALQQAAAGALADAKTEPVIADLIRALGKFKKFDQAEALLPVLPQRSVHKGTAALYLIRSAAASGDTARAKALANSIADVRLGSGPHHPMVDFPGLARAAATGDAALSARYLEQAEETATNIIGDERDKALSLVVDVAVAMGDYDRAHSMARSIRNENDRAPAVRGLLRGAMEAGDLVRAESIARTGTDRQERHRRSSVLANLVQALALAGHREKAEAIIRGIGDGVSQASVRAALAQGTAIAGDLGQAQAIVSTIGNDHQQASVRIALARTAAAAGDFAKAEAMLPSIGAESRVNVLAHLAAAARAAGNDHGARAYADRAKATIHSMDKEQPHVRERALADLVLAVAAAGESARANAIIAQEIHSHDLRERAMANLSQAAAASGDFDRAESIARRITHADHQARALVQLTTMSQSAGNVTRADTIARTVEHSEYVDVAVAETATPPRRLLARALVHGRYEVLLVAVARTAPEAVLANESRILVHNQYS